MRSLGWVVLVALAADAVLVGACASTAPPPEPAVVVVPAPPLVSSADRAPPPTARGDEPPSPQADDGERDPDRGEIEAPGDAEVHRFSFSGTLSSDGDAGVRLSFQASTDAGLRFRAVFGPDGGVFSFGDDDTADPADAGAPPKGRGRTR